MGVLEAALRSACLERRCVARIHLVRVWFDRWDLVLSARVCHMYEHRRISNDCLVLSFVFSPVRLGRTYFSVSFVRIVSRRELAHSNRVTSCSSLSPACTILGSTKCAILNQNRWLPWTCGFGTKRPLHQGLPSDDV